MLNFVLIIALSLGWYSCAHSAQAVEANNAIVVSLNRAVLLNLPPHARNIVVGNPAIVHVTPLTDAPAVLTGAAFGETNLIVLDEGGRVLMEASVLVVPQPDLGPSLLQGQDSTAYSCRSRCEVVQDLRDHSPETNAVQSESQARNANISAIPSAPLPAAGPQAHGSL